ncbi:hypothetical protein C8Q77DRAFT_243759 [Trametes polyzona]|nr:hypothetical protein C8Q77DRAFT_243759 [Trametes polyzona]
MRTPTSWNDMALLEDDPFASIFLVHKHLNPARGRRREDWIKELAQEVNTNPTQILAAKQWIAHAFTSDGATQGSGQLQADAVHVTLDLLELFVRFYWTWYNAGERAAKHIVDVERKRRGFDYRLPDISQVVNAATDGPSAAVTSPSKSQRGSKFKKRSHRKSKPGARPIRDDAAAVGSLDNDSSGEEARRSVPRSVHPFEEGGIAVTRPASHSMGVVADVTEDGLGHCAIRARPGPPEVATPRMDPGTQPHTPQELPAESASTAALASTSSSLCSPEATVSISGEATAPEVQKKGRGSREKKAQRELLVANNRERPRRNAARPERLSLLAQAETKYYENVKRGYEDEAISETVNGQAGSQDEVSQTAKPPKKKSRKSKARLLTPEPTPLATSSAAGTPSIQSQGPATTMSEHPAPSAGANVDVATPPHRHVPSKRGAKGKGVTARKRLKTSEKPTRPSKRQRGPNGDIDAIGALNAAMARQTRRAAHAGTVDVPEAASQHAMDIAPAAVAIGRKRSRSVCELDVRTSGEQDASHRTLARLPRSKSTPLRFGSVTAPAAPIGVLGVPANLQEQDRIIRDVATEALLDLHNNETVTDEWVEGDGAQDDPPSSDDEEDIPLSVALASKSHNSVTNAPDESSDEEDVPLSAIVAKNAHVSAPPVTVAPDPSALAATAPKNTRRKDRTSSLTTPPVAAEAMLPSIVAPRPTTAIRVPKPAALPPLPKKPLTAQPVIWAESRQEVCESFDWFRSYQGGVYFNNDMVKGYLLSAFSSRRDLFARDGRLIISHGGGKAESLHSKHGHSQLHEADDQREEDKSVRALLRTFQMKRPLVLIIDDRYALFPYDLAAKGYTYVVLGFYHIAHAWAEREPASNGRGHVVRYKFAFEWCKKQPEPWWLKSESGVVPPDKPRFPAATLLCPSCGKESPMVYAEAWVCLQPGCALFWTQINGSPPPAELTYDEKFLNSSFHCDHEMLEDIAPLPPATAAADGVVTSRRFCKGWHCRNCGRLSCRYKWEHWECKSCGATLQVSGKTRSPKEFWSQTNSDFMHHKLSPDSGIIVSQLCMFRAANGFGYYHVYILPENRGRIYLILGSKMINRTADEVFEEYQAQAKTGKLRFRRWPLRMHQLRGTLLTNYFSQNTGEPYQYVGGTANTVPFEGAPSAVVKARDLIQSRMASVMQAEAGQYHFNEVLSAAYMEKQKMAVGAVTPLAVRPVA